MALKQPDYRLTLRALPSDVPAEVRLRRLLKLLLRSFDLRCTRIETRPEETDDTIANVNASTPASE